MTHLLAGGGQNDEALLVKAQQWLAKDVPCVVGRREFARGRFAIAVCANPGERQRAESAFLSLLSRWEASSLLLILDPAALPPVAARTAASSIACLQRGLYGIEGSVVRSIGRTVVAPCPVTGLETAFPDFDCVAFYPEAGNEDDALYDPSLVAPFACVNMTSDLFGLSLLARELAIRLFDNPPRDLAPAERDVVFAKASGLWQGFATHTIEAIGAVTNPQRLKPAHLSADRNHYITQHDEAAFGEGEKIEHVAEMPAVYTHRIIEEWRRAFATGMPARLDKVMRPASCPMRAIPSCSHLPSHEGTVRAGPAANPLHRTEGSPQQPARCPVTRLLSRFVTRSRRAAGRAVSYVA